MKCFEHKENQSIGVCAGCLKGVCLECFCEVDEILSCKSQKCQERIDNNIQMNKKACRLHGVGKGKKEKPVSSIFYIVLGLIFMGSDLVFFYENKSFTFFGLLSGAVFSVFGLYQYFRKDRINY